MNERRRNYSELNETIHELTALLKDKKNESTQIFDRLDNLRREMKDDLEKAVANITDKSATKDYVDGKIKSVEEKYKPVKLLAFGFAGLILTLFLTIAITNLVNQLFFNKPLPSGTRGTEQEQIEKGPSDVLPQ